MKVYSSVLLKGLEGGVVAFEVYTSMLVEGLGGGVVAL